MNKTFPFSDAPNTACFTCRHVLEEHKPIVYVSHDEDGYWQFLCEKSHNATDARIVSLSEILEIDSSMASFAKLDCGYYAELENTQSDWIIKQK